MEEHRRIAEDMRSRVDAVCSDPSLSQPEKRQRIEAIRSEAHRQMASVLSPQQRQAVESCHQGRGGGGGGGIGRGEGPCGELPGAGTVGRTVGAAGTGAGRVGTGGVTGGTVGKNLDDGPDDN